MTTPPPLNYLDSGWTVAASTKLDNAELGMRTCRPTLTNTILRSATRRRVNRSPVPRMSAASSRVSSRSVSSVILVSLFVVRSIQGSAGAGDKSDTLIAVDSTGTGET